MNYKKLLALMCCVTLGLATTLTGCSSTSTTTETTTTTDASTSEEETTIYGQISTIDGDEITIALAEEASGDMQMPEGDSTEAPAEGEAPTDKPEGEAPSGDMGGKEGDSTEAPADKPEGEAPSGDMSADSTEMPAEGGEQKDGMPGVTLTGEEQTITITDDTTITIEDGDTTTEGTIDDLAEGDMITVTMSGDTVVSITVKSGMPAGGQGDGNGAPDMQGVESTEAE